MGVEVGPSDQGGREALTPEAGPRGPKGVPIRVVRLPHAAGLPLPSYRTAHASGMDLHAAVQEPLRIDPGRFAAVPTGLCLEIPPGFEAQVRPRSGLALEQGLTVLNAPGTIDADYRGEVRILLVNLGPEPVTVQRGDRVAQMVIARVARCQWVPAESLSPTERGEGGFGHTGHRI